MKIRIILMSDTAPGSGEGLTGIIDRDVNFDCFGLPYIPAKRIKGLLREAAMEYLEQATGIPESDGFQRLFGNAGISETSSLKLSNGHLGDYDQLKAVFEGLDDRYLPYFNPEFVSECYTCVRAQTTIERGPSSTAKEDTLRTTRLINKGSIFWFDLTFEQTPDPSQLELLRVACRVTCSMGLSRTRGLGEIKLELIDELAVGEELGERTAIPDGTLCTLEYIIRNQGQLVCTIAAGGNFVISDPYISGRHLLGSFAGRHIRQNGLGTDAHLDDTFHRLFLEGGLTFENAYLCDENSNRLLPVPVTVVANKETGKLYDLAYDEGSESDLKEVIEKEIQVKSLERAFCRITGADFTSHQPLMEAEYHHQRPENDRSRGHASEHSGEFFQFEVLKPNQIFKGMIRGTAAALSRLQGLLPSGSVMHLGKSKTAQYGRAVLTYGEQVCQRIGDGASQNDFCEDNLVITLTAPMVLINEYGHITPDPDFFFDEMIQRLNIAKENLEDIALDPDGRFLKFIDLGGYMGRWGLPLPQARAIDAGSVLKILNAGVPIDIARIEAKGFGLFTAHGFGTVVVNRHGQNSLSTYRPGANPTVMPEFPPAFQALADSILNNRLITELRSRAVKIFDDQHFPNQKLLANALLNRLTAIFENASDCQGILLEIKNFKNLATTKLEDLKVKIDPYPHSRSLLRWIETLLADQGAEFQSVIIDHTAYCADTRVQEIESKLSTGTVTNRQFLIQFIKPFFITLFKRMLWHNRGANHE